MWKKTNTPFKIQKQPPEKPVQNSENKVRPIFNQNLFKIRVKRYMTRKSTIDFDFMKRWNGDIPMPDEEMSGFKIKETNGLVYMDLHTNTRPTINWSGWIIKSAILTQEEIPLSCSTGGYFFEPVNIKPVEITIKIDKNNRGNFFLLVTLSKENAKLSELFTGPLKGKKMDDTTFSIRIDYYEDLLSYVNNYHFTVENPFNYDRLEDFTYSCPELLEEYPEYEYKTEPLPHQVEGYQFAMKRQAFLNADDMGLGKTKSSLDVALAKRKQFGYKHCLVICGINSIKWNWLMEIELHTNETGYLLGQQFAKNGKLTVGSVAKRCEDLTHLEDIPNYFIVTNVETIRNEQVKEQLILAHKRGQLGMIIVDEFHKMKNISCQQGGNLMELEADCKIALTGTPILNSPMDLYGLLRWLGYEKHSLFSFEKFYCDKTNKAKKTFRHMDILQRNLQNIMLRRKKEDILNLPDKIYNDEYVEMSSKQQSIYDEIYNDLLQNIDLITSCPNPLAKMIRLRQATAHSGILSNRISESAKFERLRELLDDCEGKVIIFSNWTEVTDRLQEFLKKEKPLVITGQVKDTERQAIVEEFQTNPDRKIIIGTISAMGTGLTLTAAENVIFLDEPWTDAVKEQAIDRAYRIGTEHTVMVYTLMCKDTIDEKIHSLVKQKSDLSAIMVDNKVLTGSMVHFLLGLEEEVPSL